MRRALSRANCTAGSSRDTRTPMMAITTSSSTSVKAERFWDMTNSYRKMDKYEQALAASNRGCEHDCKMLRYFPISGIRCTDLKRPGPRGARFAHASAHCCRAARKECAAKEETTAEGGRWTAGSAARG